MSSALSNRYLSVWLERLPTDRIERQFSRTEIETRPRVVVSDIKSALRLVAVNEPASKLDLAPGLALIDARAMYPNILVEHADEAADRQLLSGIVDWTNRYTPLVGADAPHGMMLDITGCAHLFGGEDAMLRDVVRRLRAQGFIVRAAIASTPGAAWAVAHYGKPGVIVPSAIRETLLPLPLAALRIDTETVDALARVGLKRIADIVDRPRAPLAARFGTLLVQRLDQAFGRLSETITPRMPVAPYMAERRFPEPIVLESDILATIEHLASELARRMEERGDGARALQVTLFRVDGAVRRLSVATSRPLRDPRVLCRLFSERFSVLSDELDPGFGFDVVRLAVTNADSMVADQVQFLSPGEQNEDIADLIDRLGARFGIRRVIRYVPQETHIPEYAVEAVAAREVQTMPKLKTEAPAQDSVAPVRPLRMFERPEAIEAVAEVPDGPPARFSWRRMQHQVTRADGPERIAMEWWRDGEGRPLTRDYFRVEDNAGRRFWLYREGLLGPEVDRTRWFMHGLFA
ncbi:MAG: DNA polymerase Y family protein [Alphaproteobacteria bacterium]|nr:DNA polymerase Y family protein [Alphaproteobacteria bacterium]